MASNFKTFSRTLLANEVITINAIGSTFRCYEGNAPFFVEPDSGNKVEIQAGIGIKFTDVFQGWVITNGATPQTVKIYIGDGTVDDSRQIGAKSSGSTTVNYGAVSVGTSATLIKILDNTRQNILLQNLSTNDLYIGDDNSVTVLNGIKISANSSATITFVSDVYGIATGAASDIRYLEELE